MKLRDYVINTDTLAILPYQNNSSIVYEKNQMVLVSKRPQSIIKSNCLRFGSSYKGRLTCTERLTGNTYKAPILIIDQDNVIFFPTVSPRLNNCSWISLNNIEKCYFDNKNNTSKIEFNNHQEVIFNVSINILNNQIYKASRLEYIIRKNKAVLG